MARYTKNDAVTIPQLNTELEKIEIAIQDTLSRKGDAPNIMEAPIDMNSQRITNLPEPVNASEPMTKAYGDVVIGLATTEANRAEAEADIAEAQAALATTAAFNAAVSESNAASSENNASTFATSALNSANLAATLYDTFDDRFLGVKTSFPSSDNDGNPLQIGAIFFYTVDNNSYVYTSLGWQAVANTATSTAAAASAILAEKWATELEDVVVDAGKYSAFHWAEKATDQAVIAASEAAAALASQIAAQGFAANANQSSIDASGYANAAQLSSLNALTSEGNALHSAQRAELAQDYLESYLFHYVSDDATSVKIGIGTQVLVSESTTGYDSVIIELGVA